MRKFLCLVAAVFLVGISSAAASTNTTFDDGTHDGWLESSGNWLVDSDGEVYKKNESGSDSGDELYFNNSSSPQVADGWIESRTNTTSTNDGARLLTRYQLNSGGDDDFYMCRPNPTADELQIYKRLSGSWTKLASQAQTYADGEYVQVNFSISGSSLECKDDKNGFSISASDSDISSKGYLSLATPATDDSNQRFDWATVSIDTGDNSAPSISENDPVDGASGVNDTVDGSGVDVNISFKVSDSDNSTLDYAAIKWENGSTIYKEQSVSSGSTIKTVVENLSTGTTYNWYAEASDGISVTKAGNYSFVTAESKYRIYEKLFFNESSGANTLTDYSGHGRDYNINGSPTFGVDGAKNFNDDKAIEFDGSTQGANITSTDNPLFGGYTFSSWVKIDSASVDDGDYNTVIARALEFTIREQNGNWTFFHREDGSWNNVYKTNDVVADTWVHLGQKWNGTHVLVYINGSKVATTAASSIEGNTAEKAEDGIGYTADTDDKYFDGGIDELKTYNKSLTDQTISNLYSCNDEKCGISLSLDSPKNKSYPESYVWVNGSTDVDTNVSYSVDGGSESNICTYCRSYSKKVTGLSDGGHSVFVNATDSGNASNYQSVNRDFTVDTNNPSLSVDGFPKNGSKIIPPFRVNTTVSDSTTSVDLKWSLDDFNTSENYNDSDGDLLVYDTCGDGGKNSDLKIRAVDDAGNTNNSLLKYDITSICGGQDHFHTTLSQDSNGDMQLETVLDYMRSEDHVYWAAPSDHAESLSSENWTYITNQVQSFHNPGEFATVLGFEYTEGSFGDPNPSTTAGQVNVHYRTAKDGMPFYGSDTTDTWNNLTSQLDADGNDYLLTTQHTLSNTPWPEKSGTNFSWVQSGFNDPNKVTSVELYQRRGDALARWQDYGSSGPLTGVYKPYAKDYFNYSRSMPDSWALRAAQYYSGQIGFAGGDDSHMHDSGDDYPEYPTSCNINDGSANEPGGHTYLYLQDLNRSNVFDALNESKMYGGQCVPTYLSVSIDGSERVPPANLTTGSHTIKVRAAAPGDAKISSVTVWDDMNNTDRSHGVLGEKKNIGKEFAAFTVTDSNAQKGDMYIAEVNVTDNTTSPEISETHFHTYSSPYYVGSGAGPAVTVHSPKNQTYSSSEVDLNVTSDEAANWTYSLDGGSNQSFEPNTTISSLSEGQHTLDVYANDSAGNVGSNSVTFTYEKPYVELGPGVEINQSGNNASINVTSSFNVSSLTTYSTATSFGGSNFSASGSLDNWIDVKLDAYNSSKGIGNYAVNFSATTVDGNNVSFDFNQLLTSAKYRVDSGSNVYDQFTSDGNGAVSFYQSSWTDGTFQGFDLLRTDNFVPGIGSPLYRDNQETGVSRLEFGLDDFSESDISSYTGTGSTSTFSNETLELDVSLPVDSAYSVSDDSGLKSSDRAVKLSKSDTGVQEHSFSHDFSKQEVNQSTTYTNDASESLDYVLNHSLPGTVTSGGNFSGTVSAGSSTTEISVSEGDFLSEKEHGFSPTPTNDEVVLGVNYMGQRPLEVVNSEAVLFTGVNTSAVVTEPVSCTQNNASTVDVAASFNGNKSVEFSCDPGNIGNPTQDIVNVSDTKERVWGNTTDMVIKSNETEETQFAIRFDKDNYKNPDDRDGGSLEAYVEGQNSEGNNQLNVTDTGSFFRVTVGTSFQQSSLHTDDDEASITYTLSGDSTDTSSGGEGGDRTSSRTVYFGDEDEAAKMFGVPFGQSVERNLRITNTERREITVNLRKGNNRVCEYITVRKSFTSDEFGDQGTYQLPEAVDNFGTVEVSNNTQLRFDLPNKTYLENQGVTDYSCTFETGASYGSAEDLVVEMEPSTGLADLLMTWVSELQEFFERSGLYNGFEYDYEICGLSEDSCEERTLGPVEKWKPLTGVALVGLIGVGYWRRR